MSEIPAGYRLVAVAPDGEVLDQVDLEGYDLDQNMARIAALDDVTTAIRNHRNGGPA